MLDLFGRDVARQLPRGFRLPVRDQAFRIQRRELFLNLVGELEIERVFAAGVTFAQHRGRLSRIVVAVVKKENDLAADFALKPTSANDFREQKSFRKKAARLLTEADDRRAHCAAARLRPRNRVFSKIQAKRSTAAQPIRLYQR